GVSPFVHIPAERCARERLRASAQSEGRLAKERTEVALVSLTCGGRAQIAAALLAQRASDAVIVHTAGSEASAEVDANVRVAMAEIGIDLEEAFTKPLTPEVLAAADVVVTMGRSVGAVAIRQLSGTSTGASAIRPEPSSTKCGGCARTSSARRRARWRAGR